jgi:hypothetical protein
VLFWAGGNTHWRSIRKEQSALKPVACQHQLARFKVPAANCQSPIDRDFSNPKELSLPGFSSSEFLSKTLSERSSGGKTYRFVIAMIRTAEGATRHPREIFSTFF